MAYTRQKFSSLLHSRPIGGPAVSQVIQEPSFSLCSSTHPEGTSSSVCPKWDLCQVCIPEGERKREETQGKPFLLGSYLENHWFNLSSLPISAIIMSMSPAALSAYYLQIQCVCDSLFSPACTSTKKSDRVQVCHCRLPAHLSWFFQKREHMLVLWDGPPLLKSLEYCLRPGEACVYFPLSMSNC